MGLRRIFSRRTRKAVGSGTHPTAEVDYVASMHGLGEAKAREGQLDEAIACWTRAVLVARRRGEHGGGGHDPGGAARALVDIGDAFASHDHWDEALAAWNEALRAQRMCLRTEWHPDVARILCKIGVAFGRSKADGDHTYSALMAFEKALEIQQDTLGPGHKDCAETANKMFKFLNNVRDREMKAQKRAEEDAGEEKKDDGRDDCSPKHHTEKAQSKLILWSDNHKLEGKTEIQVEEEEVESDEETAPTPSAY